MVARETIYQALFALVTPLLAPGAVDGPPDGNPNSAGTKAAPGTPSANHPFNLISREVIEVQRVPPNLQPVLFMDEAFEENVNSGDGLTKGKWTIYLHIGCCSQKGTASSTILNPLIDVVEPCFDVPVGEDKLTLGGLVESVELKGIAIKNLGNNSTKPDFRQAVCYLPIEITLAK